MPVDIQSLTAADLAASESLSFPAFRRYLPLALTSATAGAWQMHARVARAEGTVVGLAFFAEPPPQTASSRPAIARLHSLAVAPHWRRQGIAGRLLQSVVADLGERGLAQLETSYTTRMPAWAAFEACLQQAGWQPPQTSLQLAICDHRLLQAPWLQQLPALPAGHTLFPWSALRADEREMLIDELDSGRLPLPLSPFADESEIEAEISLGLRQGERLVGWITVIRSPLIADALCYRTLYLRPEVRGAAALGPRLILEAVQRHAASPLAAVRSRGVFGIAPNRSPAMLRFFNKRIAPHAESLYQSRYSHRLLD